MNTWFRLVRVGHNWRELARFGQDWSEMARIGHGWQPFGADLAEVRNPVRRGAVDGFGGTARGQGLKQAAGHDVLGESGAAGAVDAPATRAHESRLFRANAQNGPALITMTKQKPAPGRFSSAAIDRAAHVLFDEIGDGLDDREPWRNLRRIAARILAAGCEPAEAAHLAKSRQHLSPKSRLHSRPALSVQA